MEDENKIEQTSEGVVQEKDVTNEKQTKNETMAVNEEDVTKEEINKDVYVVINTSELDKIIKEVGISRNNTTITRTENKKKVIKGIEKKKENFYKLSPDSTVEEIQVDEYYQTLEMLIINMYDRFYKDLTKRGNQNIILSKADDKKAIILLFEKVIKSLRYLILDCNHVYQDITEPLDLLAQLCDMNNIDDLLNDLITTYVNYYDNNEEKCVIEIKSYRKEL